MKILIRLLALLACILSCEAGRAQNSARPDWRASFVPINPWRAIGGRTNYVKLDGVQFCGKIVGVTPHGIRMQGQWGQLGTLYYPVNGWSYLPVPDQPVYPEFFVTNYPFKAVADGNVASATRLMAWYAGTYTYTTANGESRTIPKLDYGVPCGPDPVLLAAAEKRIHEDEEKRRASDLRKLEFLTRDATNGDTEAQYSLGFHYLHGIGCETNQVMGIYWLLQAAAHGNVSASNALQEVENEPISTNTFKR